MGFGPENWETLCSSESARQGKETVRARNWLWARPDQDLQTWRLAYSRIAPFRTCWSVFFHRFSYASGVASVARPWFLAESHYEWGIPLVAVLKLG